ncbi:MAG: hypothetical protein LBH37_04795 [Oscillospiraceae bacterium]|jgi:hypothetical protein|nr:hypothetical protein [Oscillospiraceae bacterium]
MKTCEIIFVKDDWNNDYALEVNYEEKTIVISTEEDFNCYFEVQTNRSNLTGPTQVPPHIETKASQENFNRVEFFNYLECGEIIIHFDSDYKYLDFYSYNYNNSDNSGELKNTHYTLVCDSDTRRSVKTLKVNFTDAKLILSGNMTINASGYEQM